MKKNEEVMTEPIFNEYGITFEEGRLYRAVRSFMLKTKHGPLTMIPKGALVRLAEKTGLDLFYGCQVEPLELSETFEVLHDFQTVGADGEWVEVSRGDIIRMTRDEAMPLLVRGMIKERKDKVTK